MFKNATITSIQDVTDDLKIFTFKTDDNSDFVFSQGQFILVAIPHPDDSSKILRRAYSVASTPNSKECELFIVKPETVDNHKPLMTTLLFNSKVGDPVDISTKGAGLDMVIDPETINPETNFVMVSTGAGLSSFIGHLRGSFDVLNTAKSITLIHGCRFENEIPIPYNDEFEAFKSKYKNLKVLFAVSSPEEGSRFKKSYVTDVIQSEEFLKHTGGFQSVDSVLYICGGPKPVSSVRKLAEEINFVKHSNSKPGNIHIEKF
ncbi:MAG: hypothetical protein JJV93_02410 [Alphaproteobacteria bacterium]|nr:hypothetical protein [Alphaproteobacteria bacterium]